MKLWFFSTSKNVGDIFSTLRQRFHRNCRARQIGHAGFTFPSGRLGVEKYFKKILEPETVESLESVMGESEFRSGIQLRKISTLFWLKLWCSLPDVLHHKLSQYIWYFSVFHWFFQLTSNRCCWRSLCWYLRRLDFFQRNQKSSLFWAFLILILDF